MIATMFKTLSLVLALAAAAPAAPAAEDKSGKGTFETMELQRPRLAWEEIKGYRLFFHPSDSQPLRRSLNLAIPTDRQVINAYSLVRPLAPNPELQDAWLRVEGTVDLDRIAFQWDGMYRGAEFADGPYYYEIHVRWKDGEQLSQKVIIYKSKEHPRLVKVGNIDLEEHALEFRHGEYVPEELAGTVSKSEFPQLPLIAKAMVPTLEETFNTEGVQVSYRYVSDEDGKPARAPVLSVENLQGILKGKKGPDPDAWNCACQAPLPADSPARKAAKKVRCDWDISGLMPGIYDLRLSLYHKVRASGQIDPCDTPVLDEDRIRILVRP
jgi:hypothetical protein